MKKVMLGCSLIVLMVGFTQVVSAESMEALTERFYSGLTEIIERNMNSPDTCVSEVNSYYLRNQATIAKIRQQAQKAMQTMAPVMDSYMNMSQDELQALQSQASANAQNQSALSQVSQRYANAVQRFSGLHPQQGMKIAMKAMELMPSFDQRY